MAPWSVKEVQHLKGRLVALNRFIARLGERIPSFFKTLRNISNYEWTLYCQKAFEELKVHFSPLKILSKSRKSEFCFLIWKCRTQQWVMFWLKSIGEYNVQIITLAELFTMLKWYIYIYIYMKVEKIILIVVSASRKLKPYFQAH